MVWQIVYIFISTYFCMQKQTKIMTLFNNFFSSVSVSTVHSQEHHDTCMLCCWCWNLHSGIMVLSWMRIEFWHERRNCWIKSLFLFSLHTNINLVASENYSWSTDVTWTIFMMFLLPFWVLKVSVVLPSMQGQKALGFHHKYRNLCSKMNEGLTSLEWHE